MISVGVWWCNYWLGWCENGIECVFAYCFSEHMRRYTDIIERESYGMIVSSDESYS